MIACTKISAYCNISTIHSVNNFCYLDAVSRSLPLVSARTTEAVEAPNSGSTAEVYSYKNYCCNNRLEFDKNFV